MATPNKINLTMLRIDQVKLKIGLSKSTIYSKLDSKSPFHDPAFPKRVRLGANSIGFIEAEIDAWIQSRVNFSRIGVEG